MPCEDAYQFQPPQQIERIKIQVLLLPHTDYSMPLNSLGPCGTAFSCICLPKVWAREKEAKGNKQAILGNVRKVRSMLKII